MNSPIERMLTAIITSVIADDVDNISDEGARVSIKCMFKYQELDRHLARVSERYTKPADDPVSDKVRDSALKQQRQALLQLMTSFDEALTNFEKTNPIPIEFDDFTEKE